MKTGIALSTRTLLTLAVGSMLSLAVSLAEAHTIAELYKTPAAFDQQSVTVTGEVAHMVTRYGDATYTTFELVDEKGAELTVLVSKAPDCKQGEICRVHGLFVAEKHLILPEKLEKIAEGNVKEAGVLFRQRRSGMPGAGGRGLRGVYIPQ